MPKLSRKMGTLRMCKRSYRTVNFVDSAMDSHRGRLMTGTGQLPDNKPQQVDNGLSSEL